MPFSPNNSTKRASGAVSLADQGYFWVGLNYTTREGHTVVDGTQMYVEYQKPEKITQKFPIVLIHGGGGQGLDWISTPDGRPGWRTLLLQQGYEVYVVDRPGHGRSPVLDPNNTWPGITPSVESLGPLFAGSDNPDHVQWPGNGRADDAALAQLLASQGPMTDFSLDHQLMQQHGAELLERIGPSIIVTSSAGGPAGWLVADARPDLVEAVIALEPLGPSGVFPLPWGLASVPMHYQPKPPSVGLQLTDVPATDDTPAMRLQPEPAHQLPNLVDLPIAVVSSDQSFAKAMDLGTVAFLRQAGCRRIRHLQLNEYGLHGNGHLMMIEQNNAAVLDVLLEWIDHHVDSRLEASSKK